MHLYLDTAEIDQIRKGVKLGVVSGVTTNPSLVYKAGWTDYKSAVQEICSIVKGPVSVEVLGQDVSPFVGRLDDVGENGMALVGDIVSCFDHYKFGTQVIAASIRHPLHCVAAAKAGAHISTVPYGVLTQMINHPLTMVGIARFLEDAQKAAGKG